MQNLIFTHTPVNDWAFYNQGKYFFLSEGSLKASFNNFSSAKTYMDCWSSGKPQPEEFNRVLGTSGNVIFYSDSWKDAAEYYINGRKN